MDAPPIDPPSSGSDGPGAADAPAPGPGPAPRRLRRRVGDRLLGGVAGGVADFFGVDVVLVRLGFVVAAFFGGIGVLAYVLGWVVLPVGAPSEAVGSRPGDRKQLLGYGLVALGLLAIGGRVGLTFRAGGAFWPLALIALGAAVLWLRTRDVFQEPAASPVTATVAARSRPPSRQPTAVSTVAVPPTVEQPVVSA